MSFRIPSQEENGNKSSRARAFQWKNKMGFF
jgi:hypothetical protein